jgi:hypothetical protein
LNIANYLQEYLDTKNYGVENLDTENDLLAAQVLILNTLNTMDNSYLRLVLIDYL